MTSLKIASWNINSVRARAHIVERLLAEEAPDILCLQETKAMDAVFPAELFDRLGYRYRMLNGQKMHHGVAIVSKVPLHEDLRHDWQDNGKRGMSERGSTAESASRMSMCRPGVTCPTGRSIPSSGKSSISSNA